MLQFHSAKMSACMVTILIVRMWILVAIIRPLILFAEAKDVKFNFPLLDKSATSVKSIGDALSTQNGIELTKSDYNDNLNWSLGWAVYENPIEIWSKSSGGARVASFQSHFQFAIHNETSTKMDYRADGLSFFMAPQGSEPPINGSGMWLGLLNDTLNGKSSTQKVAVEFDTFKNADIDEYHSTHAHDPDDNHVGIDINNITSVKTASLMRERLNSGRIWDVWIDYDGQQKKLRVFMSPNGSINSDSPPPPRHPILTYYVNLAHFLPEKVIVGFSASTGLSNQMHNVISWNFSSQTNWTRHDSGRRPLIVGSVAGVAVVFVIGLLITRTRRSVTELQINSDPNGVTADEVSERALDETSPSKAPREYRYDELSAATNDFRKKLILGEGGFGKVYKGTLHGGETVAIKRISQNSQQGIQEYKSEIKVIDRLSHANLVPLLGWSHDRNGELLLVYEFMSNGSLDKYLFGGRDQIRPLNWIERYSVACDLASALVHLHEESNPRVLHRDIKASNVMLDSSFVGRLGDFGLARLMEHDNTSLYTNPAGTLGYIAPECFDTLRASSESDVFSFGAVALEIACGRRAVDRGVIDSNMKLVNWVWSLYEIGQILDAADQGLDKQNDGTEIERLMLVGLWCSNPDYKQRPKIKQALQALKFEATMPVLPRCA